MIDEASLSTDDHKHLAHPTTLPCHKHILKKNVDNILLQNQSYLLIYDLYDCSHMTHITLQENEHNYLSSIYTNCGSKNT